MSSFATRLKIALNQRGIKQSVLAYKCGVDQSTISNYLKGRYEPKNDMLVKLGAALDVDPAWLAGYDVPMREESNDIGLESYGLRKITKKRFPMLGEIACGTPIFAEQDFESFIDTVDDIDADFCLTAKGDSMIDARIKDGDVVFIKQMPIVQNGEIAAVIVDGEATLKKWFYYPDKQKLVLNPANQNYEPLVYTGTELDTIVCLGKAVCYMSKL